MSNWLQNQYIKKLLTINHTKNINDFLKTPIHDNSIIILKVQIAAINKSFLVETKRIEGYFLHRFHNMCNVGTVWPTYLHFLCIKGLIEYPRISSANSSRNGVVFVQEKNWRFLLLFCALLREVIFSISFVVIR